MRLLQFLDEQEELRVGIVNNPEQVQLLEAGISMYQLAWKAIDHGASLKSVAREFLTEELISYSQLIEQKRIALPLSHPDYGHTLVSGTGLTHLGSASTRNEMHTVQDTEQMSDSMKMFQAGIEGGKPQKGEKGTQPEWFYKGDGACLIPSGYDLQSPPFGLDFGEEPEIVGIYLIGPGGQPFRLGFALGNEASDHITEKQNYLLLAHSKLRQCSIGPELLIGEFPDEIRGVCSIWRGGEKMWEKEFLSGSDHMSHSISNLEYHHFKYSAFRRPGDVHIHFFGTSTLSFADEIRIQEGDEIEISAKGWGRPLKNRIITAQESYLPPKSL